MTLSKSILVMLLLLLTISCSRREPLNDRGSRYIIPDAGQGIVLNDVSLRSESSNTTSRPPAIAGSLRVSVPDNYVILDIIERNLDDDDDVEQVIVFKRVEDLDDAIRFLIADFDAAHNTYVRAWQERTSATNIATFIVETFDLTGDGSTEIVCHGIDSQGTHTLDVYTRDPASTLETLSYLPIASLSSPVGIEVERNQYRQITGEQSQQSYPLVVYSRSVEAEQDLVRQIYQWQPETGHYAEAYQEIIPSALQETEQLTALFNGDLQQFREFLQGPWNRSVSNIPSSANDDLYNVVVLFDVQEEDITLFRDAAQESYLWVRSFKTSVNALPALRLTIRNQILDTIIRQVLVVVHSSDRIAISAEEDDLWDGIYQRLRPIEQPGEYEADLLKAQFTLQGLYRNDLGMEINFDAPHLTVVEDGIRLSGGFVLYQLGEHILEINFVDSYGILLEERIYWVEHLENHTDTHYIRTLRLTPALLHVGGLQILNSNTVVLEQLEEIVADRRETADNSELDPN